MRPVVPFLIFCGMVAATFVPTAKPQVIQTQDAFAAPVVIDDAAAPEPTVYNIRARGWDSRRQAIYANAVAVLVGGKLEGPAHLLDGMTGTPIVEVEIGKVWQPCQYQRHGNQDWLTITVPGQVWDPMGPISETRLPVYGERVTVHAAKSGKMQGTVFSVNPLYVGIDADCVGIRSGDSGSPICSESGEVLGIVTGFRATPGFEEPRSIIGESVASGRDAPSSPVPAAPSEVVPPAPQGVSNNCPGGVCPQPVYRYQPQRRRLLPWLR